MVNTEMLASKFFSIVRLLIFGFIFSLLGCGGLRPKPFSPLPALFPSDLPVATIKRVINDRYIPLDTLWARFKIYLWGRNIKGRKFFQATVLYKSPDMLRLRGYRTLTSTLFELIWSERKIAIFHNKEKRLYQGTIEEWENDPELSAGLNIRDIISSINVERGVARLLESNNTRLYSIEEYYVFLAPYPSELSASQHEAYLVIKIRKGDLLVKELGLYDEDNKLRLKVNYRGYGLYQGVILPREVVLDFLSQGISIRLKAINYQLNRELSPLTFEFPQIKGMEVLPLQMLKSAPAEERS